MNTSSAEPIVVSAMGHYFPETILDNNFYDQLDIGSSAEWIGDRVGIKERRSVLAKDDIIKLRRGEVSREELLAAGKIPTLASLAEIPWQIAKKRARFAEYQRTIDTVIAGTSVPDWDIPANACHIAGHLGLECTAFDVNSACATFVVNLHVASGLLKQGQAHSIGIFNCDRYTTRIDYSDRKTCVLFGDSSIAAIIERKPPTGGLQLIDTIVESAPSGYRHVYLQDGGTFNQDGKAVQKFAITRTISAIETILERNHRTTRDIDYFISHQANLRMLNSAVQKLGIPERCHLYNVDVKGNQGATGAPSVLSENWDRFRTGDIIVVSVVGSGLTWGAALFKKL